MRVAVLVSGGKDSALALHRVLKQGYSVKCLVAMIPKREDSWMFHYPNIRLVDLFAEASGFPLVKGETPGIKEAEVEDLKNLLSKLDVEGIVSGAVASQYQKSRIDKICGELGLESIAPLWHEDQVGLLRELLALEFEVIIVGVYAHGFDETWLGRILNEQTVEELVELSQRFGISPVGEGGEYESFVLDAPYFKKKIRLIEAERLWEDGYGHLLVKRATLVLK